MTDRVIDYCAADDCAVGEGPQCEGCQYGVIVSCTMQEKACGSGKGYSCRKCGFNQAEALRRDKVSLTLGPDGLRRKYLGDEREDDG